ncbi:hypothetical protein [Streptomyces sp. NBC_01089]|uniref:hypothetical protein n=1 Tax=Streptomyces sp. NBC_01089 TaxID=2903747 RepID=UPI0038645BE8|nr:hypothetical protein OG510_28570 [Streptomyces sp. NBC_01089]
MGWTVLYVGFGFVALWLLGEVLLQYKARLRWRLLAFTGFLGVVFGVLLHSVPVIVVGAIAFAVGQLYVTLSFRRGFSTGWAIKGAPRENKRRRARGGSGAKDPVLEVSDLQYEQQPGQEPQDGQDQPGGAQYDTQDGVFAQHGQDADGYGQSAYGGSGYGPDGGFGHDGTGHDGAAYAAYPPGAADSGTSPGQDPSRAQEPMAASVYAPEPMPDETGQYGIYSDTAYGTGAQYGTGYDQNGGTYDSQYGYGGEQQQYAAYSDPYIGAGQYGASYGGQQQYADPYADQYANDTPPGGVWVPQQRDTEPAYGEAAYGAPRDPEHPDHSEYSAQQPYQSGHNGYNEQQRY